MVKLISFPLSSGFRAIERQASEAIEAGWIFLTAAHVPSVDGPGAFVVFAIQDPTASLAAKAPDQMPLRFVETPESPNATDILPEPEVIASNGGNGADHGNGSAVSDNKGRL